MEEIPRLDPEDQLIVRVVPANRINQRLGHLSIGKDLSPRINNLGGDSLHADDLADTLLREMRELAEERAFGVGQLVIRHAQNVIESIIDDPTQRADAIAALERKIAEEIEGAEEIEEEIHKARQARKPKLKSNNGKHKKRPTQWDLSAGAVVRSRISRAEVTTGVKPRQPNRNDRKKPTN
jgi:hypothetical protein